MNNSTKVIVQLFCAIALFCAYISLTSCGAKSAPKVNEDKSRKAMRVQELYQTSNLKYHVLDSSVFIRYVDTMHKSGDVITLAAKQYRVL